MARHSIPLQWFQADAGRLAIGGRPRLRAFSRLATEGCTHVLTLQSENEDAAAVGAAATAAGIAWLWLPFAHGRPPAEERDEEIAAMLDRVAVVLAGGGGVLLHCAAGIHRTGMIAYALLRWIGLDGDRARAALVTLRAVTADGVGEERISWAERFVRARRPDPPGHPWAREK